MNYVKLFLILMICLLVGATACQTTFGCNLLLDPAIRHTNGIPIASSEPLRAGSVSWCCNPDKLGYCGGVYYCPCVDSLRPSRLKAAKHGCYTPPQHTYEWFAGRVCPPCEPTGMIEGIEPPGLSTLGDLPNDRLIGQGVELPVGPQRPPSLLGR